MAFSLKLPPKRLHDLMYAMIYPGVLGSFLMEFADKWYQGCFKWLQLAPWLCGFLFVILFTLDYVYSLAEEIKNRYSGREFFSDLVIVVLIYLTGHAIFNAGDQLPVSCWIFMTIAKVASMFWERPIPKDEKKTIRFLKGSDVLICLGFGLGLIVSSTNSISNGVQIGWFSVLLIIDGLLYLASISHSTS